MALFAENDMFFITSSLYCTVCFLRGFGCFLPVVLRPDDVSAPAHSFFSSFLCWPFSRSTTSPPVHRATVGVLLAQGFFVSAVKTRRSLAALSNRRLGKSEEGAGGGGSRLRRSTERGRTASGGRGRESRPGTVR